jgi:UDP-N-acetylmuramate--alanine ligase
MVFLGRTKRIHFVGIGGIGMSGIAEVLLNLGFEISGSDLRRSETTMRLAMLGATVSVGHEAAHVEGADVVVYSSAVTDANPEVAAALDRGIPAIPRTEMLAELMRLKFAVTVAGSHGKTSTTSLAAAVLAAGGLDPTVIVGGKLRAISTNARLGSGRYIVAEADESDGQFVRLPSSIAVVTNIDMEHLDYYPDLDAIKRGFVEYASRVPFYGSVILCADDENVRSVAPEIRRRKVMYSLGGAADITGTVIERVAGGTRFSVHTEEGELGEIMLGIPGDHYARNALAAVAIGLEMEISFHAIKGGLESFEGVGRRFEVKGETPERVLVVDDYGHHPTEIAATVQAALHNYGRRLFVIFQPHRYTRTRAVAGEFVHCFDGAHKVYVTDIYPAGEKPIPGVDAMTIIERARKGDVEAVVHGVSFEEIVASLAQELEEGDMVITMGAGDIYKAGELLLERLGAAA